MVHVVNSKEEKLLLTGNCASRNFLVDNVVKILIA